MRGQKFDTVQSAIFTDPKDAARSVVRKIQMVTGLVISEPIDFGSDPNLVGWKAKFKNSDGQEFIAKGEYVGVDEEEDADGGYYWTTYGAEAELEPVK